MDRRNQQDKEHKPELVQGYNSLQSTEFGSHLSWMDRHNQLGIQYNFVVLLCCKYHLDNLSPGQTLCLDIFFLVDTLYNVFVISQNIPLANKQWFDWNLCLDMLVLQGMEYKWSDYQQRSFLESTLHSQFHLC